MKSNYNSPVMTIRTFNRESILTASSGGGSGETPTTLKEEMEGKGYTVTIVDAARLF